MGGWGVSGIVNVIVQKVACNVEATQQKLNILIYCFIHVVGSHLFASIVLL